MADWVSIHTASQMGFVCCMTQVLEDAIQFCSMCILSSDFLWIFINSSTPGQNGRHFGRRQIQRHFLEWKWYKMRISLKFVHRSVVDNKPALVQVMAWCWIGDKPLSEPMLTHFTDAYLQHWGEMSFDWWCWVMHAYPSVKYIFLSSENDLLLIGPLQIDYNEISNILIQPNGILTKMPSAKWQPFCPGPNV